MQPRLTTLVLFSLALACRGVVTGHARADAAAEDGGAAGVGGAGGKGGAPVEKDAATTPDAAGGLPPDAELEPVPVDAAPGPDVTSGQSIADVAPPRDRAAPPRDTAPVPRDTASPPGPAFQLLVLSKTVEYHHDSIPACQQMLRELGATPDAGLPAGARPGSRWTVTVANEDLSDFTDEGLARFAMIFWCNPTGTVFSSGGPNGEVGKAAVQKFLTSGGAWGGVHSATDFENTGEWKWFQDQVNGGNFASHDADGTPDTILWESGAQDHPVIRGVRAPWDCRDEWYRLNRDPGTLPGFVILGKLGSDQRPAVWVREIPGGGRSFYTIRGHGTSVYAEPSFRRLIHQGILWAVRRME